VFYFTGPESAFGMNPGACILDAFGQADSLCHLFTACQKEHLLHIEPQKLFLMKNKYFRSNCREEK
ncbi:MULTISPECIES: hypothetical protein, partial [unclassified Microcoleus]|uniref:hypothetical protein n=1 Tax=unclassified Microcoleus TaxID=2642155 RepID=UPI002FD034C5